jgi:two-component system LytT family response regulator
VEREADIEVVGEAPDGIAAADAISKLRPDLLFLDVQLPGIEVLRSLERATDRPLPVVVLITSYDVHALMAFELQALDYLLKPFSQECVDRALRGVRSDVAQASSPGRAKIGQVLEKLDAARRGGTRAGGLPQRFAVREGDRIILVKASDLQAVEAAGNYVKLVVLAGNHLLRLTLADMEQQLDPARFVRIHRSTLVNTDHVEEIRLSTHGDCEVVLKNGATYRVSRGHREKLLAAYGGT